MSLLFLRGHYDTNPLRSSLAVWLVMGAPAVTVVVGCAYSFGLVAWAYVHSPNMHLHEVTVAVLAMPIITFVIASIAQIIAYVLLPLYVLALLRLCGRVPLALLIAASPLLGLSVWFGYEYFVPDFRLYFDERPPYVYGLTLLRFLYGWALEIIIVLLYWWPFRRLRLPPAAAQAGIW